MRPHSVGLLGPSLLSLLVACSFEPPAIAPAPDASQPTDARPADASPSDASPSDAIADAEPSDGGDLGPLDLGEPDAADADAEPSDAPPMDAGRAPLASAGPDQRACPGAVVRLDGTGSEGDALSFAWSSVSGPAVILDDPGAAEPSFAAPTDGALEFQLEVSNALGTDVDTTVVTIEPALSFTLGPERKVRAGDTVSLSVTTATAIANAVLFEWLQLSGPAINLQGADTATLSFTAPAAGEVAEFQLTASDACGVTESASVLVRVNRPPVLVFADPDPVLAHDTVLLDASSASDPDGDVLSFEWSFVSGPAGHTGGFEPFPGRNNPSSASPTPSFYPTVPGLYFLSVTVSDGVEETTVATSLTVASFSSLPYIGGVLPGDSRAIAVRPGDGNVFVGTQTGAQEYQVLSNSVVTLGCINADQVSVVRVAPGGRVYFGFANARRIQELAAGGGCVSQTHDPGSVLNPNPSSIRDLLVTPRGDLYVATNVDVAFFSRTSTAFTREIWYSAVGGANSDYSAIGLDGSGYHWFASREASTTEDGAVRVLDPLAAPTNSARIDFLAGNDDLHAFLTGLVARPAINEMWVLSRTRGVLRISDADTPQVFRQYTIQNGGLPPALLQDELTRGVYDPDTQDVWIAMRSGIARYKRDVDAFVPVSLTALGVTGRVYDLAFDQGSPRGRALYVATQDGVRRAAGSP